VHLAMRAITLDPRDLDRPLAIPCGNCAFDDRDAFRRVTSHRFPGFRSCETLSGLNALPNPAHRSRLGAAAACVSTYGSELLGQRRVSVQAILRSLGRRDARCVGPTSAFSRSSYEHSRLVGSRFRRSACVLRVTRGFAFFTEGRFASAGHSQCRWTFLFSIALRDDRTSDTPVATLVVRSPLARIAHLRKPPRPCSNPPA